MKKYALAFALFFSIAASAQVFTSSGGMVLTGSAPSGPCTAGVPGYLITTTGQIWTCQSGTWAAIGAGTPFTYPAGTGITVVTGGAAWGTTIAAPTGAIVGDTDTQTLTNKTVDGVTPTVFGFVDPTSSIQTQLNAKAPIASPTFTGVASAPQLAATSAGTNLTPSISNGVNSQEGFMFNPGDIQVIVGGGDYEEFNGGTIYMNHQTLIGGGSPITSSGPGGAMASGAFAAAYTCPTSTSSTLGCASPDNTTIKATAGVYSVQPSFYGLYPYVTPLVGNFAAVNQGGATFAFNSTYLEMTDPPVSGDHWRLLTQAVPGVPYTATVTFFPFVEAAQASQEGICLYDSGSGKIATWQYSYNTALAGAAFNFADLHYTNFTTFSATAFSVAVSPRIETMYTMRVKDDGTNRLLYGSFDGLNFVQLFSESHTAFVTPNQIGPCVDAPNTTTPVAMSVASWVVTTP